MNKLYKKTDGILNFSDYRRLRFKIVYGCFYAILLTAVLVCGFPLLWLLFSGFKDPKEIFSTEFSLFPKEFQFSRITSAFSDIKFLYLNSLLAVIGAIVCAVLFNGLLAYVISVLKPKGHKIINFLIIVTMLIPSILNMVSLLQNITKIGLMESYISIWLSYGANAYYYILFKTYFDRLPRELFEAAQMDGCNSFTMFTKITVPVSLPIISVVSIFTVNAAWNDFLLPYLVLQSDPSKHTLMVRIYSLTRNPPAGFTQDKLLLFILMAMIPVILLFAIFQKKITTNVAGTGIK